MAKRWYLSPVVGTGTLDDPYRAQIEASGAAHAALIPTNANGTPRFAWCLVRVAAGDLSGIEADSRLFSFSDDLDTPLSSLPPARRTVIIAAIQRITGITPQGSQTRRQLLGLIGRLLEPSFADAAVDVLDPADPAFPAVTGGAGGAAFVQDSFTGANGTNLEAHTGELGATWAKQPGQAGTLVITGNTLHGSTSSRAMYYASGTCSTPDMDVSIDVTNANSGPLLSGGVLARASTSAATAYLAFLSGGNGLAIYKSIAGTFTLLSPGTFVQTAGVTYTLKFSIIGTTLTTYMNGTLVGSTIDSALTSDVRAGFEVSSGQQNDRVFDNFLAWDPNAAGQADLAVSDSGTLTATETVTIRASTSLSDGGTLSVTEVIGIVAYWSLSDGGALSVTESASVQVLGAPEGRLLGTHAIETVLTGRLSSKTLLRGATAIVQAVTARMELE